MTKQLCDPGSDHFRCRSARKTGNTQDKSYDQLDGEPDFDYTLFQIYLGLGPKRSLRKTTGLYYGTGVRVNSVHKNIERASSMWNWPERAQAWDRDQAQQVVEIERDERLAARRRRLQIVNEMLESVVQVLRKADLAELGRYEARAWLPVMRLMLKDLLVAQRAEYENPEQDMGEQSAFDVFRADDFAHAMEQLALWSKNLDAGAPETDEVDGVILIGRGENGY